MGARQHRIAPGDHVRCIAVAGLHGLLELNQVYEVVECGPMSLLRLRGMGLSYFSARLFEVEPPSAATEASASGKFC